MGVCKNHLAICGRELAAQRRRNLHADVCNSILCMRDQVASFEEELAAKQAQTVISTLSIFASNPNVVATLRNAKDKAIRAMTTFPSERLLNEARHTIVNVLSDLIHAIEHGPLTGLLLAPGANAAMRNRHPKWSGRIEVRVSSHYCEDVDGLARIRRIFGARLRAVVIELGEILFAVMRALPREN
jgi:hypothetical protein